MGECLILWKEKKSLDKVFWEAMFERGKQKSRWITMNCNQARFIEQINKQTESSYMFIL